MLPRIAAVVGSSRDRNPGNPLSARPILVFSAAPSARLAFIEADANQCISGARIDDVNMLSVHPSSAVPPISPYVVLHFDPHLLLRLHLHLHLPPPLPPTTPLLRYLGPPHPPSPTPPPSALSTSASGFTPSPPPPTLNLCLSSVLRSLPHLHGASALRPAPASFGLTRHLAHLPQPLGHFCIDNDNQQAAFVGGVFRQVG
ncbi:hypothetical protein R3P38DRAFT_1707092 [Favolaschia claudopus]|uniref:Uncharacterized protein n=1 Tax=Favolaschia claudopus TaxID=2862362 RepID=A0AAW0ACG9_9AGAR